MRGLIAAALVQLPADRPRCRNTARGPRLRWRATPTPRTCRCSARRWTIPIPALAAQKARLERLLTIRFDEDTAARVAAIDSFRGDLGVDVRATLNPLVTTRRAAALTAPEGPQVARLLDPELRGAAARRGL